jgi:hypothetical protein
MCEKRRVVAALRSVLPFPSLIRSASQPRNSRRPVAARVNVRFSRFLPESGASSVDQARPRGPWSRTTAMRRIQRFGSIGPGCRRLPLTRRPASSLAGCTGRNRSLPSDCGAWSTARYPGPISTQGRLCRGSSRNPDRCNVAAGDHDAPMSSTNGWRSAN